MHIDISRDHFRRLVSGEAVNTVASVTDRQRKIVIPVELEFAGDDSIANENLMLVSANRRLLYWLAKVSRSVGPSLELSLRAGVEACLRDHGMEPGSPGFEWTLSLGEPKSQ